MAQFGTNVSCQPGNPFVLLGEGTDAPILNYNLPQATCYDIKGVFPLSIPESFFDPALFVAPADTIWDQVLGLTYEEIIAILKNDIIGGHSPVILMGAELLQRKQGAIKFLSTKGRKIVAKEYDSETILVTDQNLNISRLGRKVGGVETGFTLPNNGGGGAANFPGPIRVNHQSAIPEMEPEMIQIAGYTLDYIAQQVQQGLIPEVYIDFSGKIKIRFIPKPTPKPRLTMVEHYKMCSYLGNYGAGKVLKTFSLLPGERTTISIRSYKDKTSSYTKSSSTNTSEYGSTYYSNDESSVSQNSEHILDSFSQHSAEQLQTAIESSNSASWSNDWGNSTYYEAGSGSGTKWGIACLAIELFGSGSSSSLSTGTSATSNASRQNVMQTINSALQSTVSESSQYRDVDVNTTTGNAQNSSSGGSGGYQNSISVSQQESILIKAGEETTTLRQISNINWSRTLNFAFRQMLQEYIVLTYLNDFTLVFSTGFPSATVEVRLSQIDDLLPTLFPDPVERDQVKKMILLHLCNVRNYQEVNIPFAEKVTETWNDCVDGGAPIDIEYWRKKFGLTDSWTDAGFTLTVPGVITNVSRFVLKTDSVIADAILGQGEALDCYNIRLQNEAAEAAELQNQRYNQDMTQDQTRFELAIQTLNDITDPEIRGKVYKQIFGECCDEQMLAMIQNTPQ